MLENPLITNISNTKKAFIYKEIISKCYNINGDRDIHITCSKHEDIKTIKERLQEMANIIAYECADISTLENTCLNICNTTVYIEVNKRKKEEHNHLKDVFKTNKQKTLILHREGLEEMPDIWQKAFNNLISELDSKHKQTMCS